MKLTPYLQNILQPAPSITYEKLKESELLIFKLLTSKIFRSHSISPELEKQVKNNLNFFINRNLPLEVIIPFGGYKLWRIPFAPEVNWAEVFNLIQIRNYLSPIAQVYQPGVNLTYLSGEILISKMNQYPQKDLNRYHQSFQEIITLLSQKFPSNMRINLRKVRDRIPESEFWELIDKNWEKTMKKFKESPVEYQKLCLDKSERNYCGDLNHDSLTEKHSKIWYGAMYHEVYISIWNQHFLPRFQEKSILLGFRYTNNWGIPLLSSRTSYCQFWIGLGVLLKRKTELIPGIFTYQQYLQHKDQLRMYPVHLFPKNFIALQKIPVFSEN